MGYLYVFKDEKTDEKITLGSFERRKEFRVLVEEFKKIMNQFTFERINAEDVKICGLDQSFLKITYTIDTTGCARLTYKDILTLLNSIKIQASAVAIPTTSITPTTKTATGSQTVASSKPPIKNSSTTLALSS